MSDWTREIRQRLGGLKLGAGSRGRDRRRISSASRGSLCRLAIERLVAEAAYREALAELCESKLLARELLRIERPIRNQGVELGARRTNMPGAKQNHCPSGNTTVLALGPN